MIHHQFVILSRAKHLSRFNSTTETLRCAQGDSF